MTALALIVGFMLGAAASAWACVAFVRAGSRKVDLARAQRDHDADNQAQAERWAEPETRAAKAIEREWN